MSENLYMKTNLGARHSQKLYINHRQKYNPNKQNLQVKLNPNKQNLQVKLNPNKQNLQTKLNPNKQNLQTKLNPNKPNLQVKLNNPLKSLPKSESNYNLLNIKDLNIKRSGGCGCGR